MSILVKTAALIAVIPLGIVAGVLLGVSIYVRAVVELARLVPVPRRRDAR